MKTILAPIDFSVVSKQVVKQAATLARALDARVVLINVTEPPYMDAEFIGVMVDNLSTLTEAAAQYAVKHLTRWKKTLEDAGLRVDIVQQTGYPTTLILEQAKKLGPDYIVMGSHGHTAIYDLLIGSVAHGVLHRAHCPVVIVPPVRRKARR
jgi:nucleotide-binding universal stress UspA family protein